MRTMIVKSLVTKGLIWGFASCASAQATIDWKPTSGTNSWFIPSNWVQNVLPGEKDTARLQTAGVCVFDANASGVVDRVNIMGSSALPLPELIVEPGAHLTVGNYFWLGRNEPYGKCTVRGRVGVLNGNTHGVLLGGRSSNVDDTDRYGELVIDGGVFQANLGGRDFDIGAVGTGVVSIINGGILHNAGEAQIGRNTGQGTVTLNNGSWTNQNSLWIGRSGGRGTVEMNGGILSITNALIYIGQGSNGNGAFFLNDGQLEARTNAINAIQIGTSGGTGLFVQNGGTATASGMIVGEATGVGTATVIFSNGVFNATSVGLGFDVYAGSRFVMAGGTFNATDSSTGRIRTDGLLELRSGTLAMENNFRMHSNATIRVIGPLWDFSTTWWIGNSDDVRHLNMEVILTRDAGHLSTIRATAANACALPRTLKVGLDGGACLLSTHAFGLVEAANVFESYLDPATAYGLDLWDSATISNYDGGTADLLRISLKAAALQGAVSLPSASTLGIADRAYGYVSVSGMDSGTLPALEMTLSLTEVDGTTAGILADLQAAGYTNSVMAGANAITMKIPKEDLATDTGYFAWDFRGFDGTTKATVSALNFQFAPTGSLITIR